MIKFIPDFIGHDLNIPGKLLGVLADPGLVAHGEGEGLVGAVLWFKVNEYLSAVNLPSHCILL